MRGSSGAVGRFVGRAVLVPVLLFCVPLAGCGGAPPAGHEPRASDINAVPREELAAGGAVRWGVTDFPHQWNPYHPQGNLAAVGTVLGALLPSPFRTDAEGRVRPDPDYVVEHRVHTGPRQVLYLRLNPEARWSDGAPVTWRDYAAMAEALGGEDADYQAAATPGYDRIADVSPGDTDFEAVITFARPYAEFGSLFDPLLPRSVTATPEAFNTALLGALPETAGPFAVADLDPRARTVTLARDDRWWGEAARLDRLEFQALPPGSFEGAFLDGGIDTYPLPLDPSAHERALRAEDGAVRAATGPRYRQLTLNGASPALSDVRVRRAVFLAVDRRVLARSALGGLGWPVRTLDHRMLLEQHPHGGDTAGEWAGHDPRRAARLLADAGWREADASDSPRVRDGRELRLRLPVPRGHGPARDEAELVRHMLGEVGIEVVVEQVDGGELFAGYVLPGNFDLVAFNYQPGAFPVTATYAQWAGPGADGRWGSNVARIAADGATERLDRALGEHDPARAAAHIDAADRLLWEAGHTLPLYQGPELVAVRSGLANLGAAGLADLDYADIGWVRR